MVALAGESNTETSTLAAIENNRFELAKHYNKRLCVINEAGKFGGQLNMLKAMTGGDHLPIERKHQQQSGTFVYKGLVLMATNDDISTSDSGVARRRITVRFNKVASESQKKDWIDRGGETALLHQEIPGLIRHLIELSESDIYDRINNPPNRVKAENVLGLRAANSVADWLLEECEFDPKAKTQIGQYKPDDPLAGNKLFPAYRSWCDATGRTHPKAQNKFKSSLIETAATLGHELTESRCIDTRVVFIGGLKLRKTFSANMPSVPSSGFETEGTYQYSEGTEATEGTFEKTSFQKMPNSTGSNDNSNDYQLAKSGSTGGTL
jgi:putative DNA primase/helicase